MKKIQMVFLSFFLLTCTSFVFAGGSADGTKSNQQGVNTLSGGNAAQNNVDAGLLETPKRRYRIAFSNGDMNNSWRWSFVQSMTDWAAMYQNLGPGVDFIWTNSHADSARQLMDCETLLASKPDILILSPTQEEPLDPVIDLATRANVPLMVIDRSLVRKPGVGTYFLNITQNYAFSGMYQAIYALEYLKDKYGSYKGKIIEIQGQLGASPNTDEYVGFRAVLKYYPEVQIIATGESGYSQEGGRTLMEGFLQRYPRPNDFDLIVSYSDSAALGAVEAILAANRMDLMDGRIISKDGDVEYIELIQQGKALMTTECSPFYGSFAVKTAIAYLNGIEKPDPVVYLPLRCWENPNDNIKLTPAKSDKEINQSHIDYSKPKNLALVPPESGNYDDLAIDLTKTQGYDEIMEYSRTRQMPRGITDRQNVR
jgi:ABC-type sugar transport system substrate-binding protein